VCVPRRDQQPSHRQMLAQPGFQLQKDRVASTLSHYERHFS